MSDNLKEMVVAHVVGCIGIPMGKINLDQDLFNDLGVDGDDAYELIMSLSNKFGVDIEGFDIFNHFGGERSISIFQ